MTLLLTLAHVYFNGMSSQHGNTLAGISTVAKNEAKHSARDVVRAKEARKFQASMGLSLKGLLNEINNVTIRNNHITCRAARVAESIYGPCIDNLAGKTTYRTGEPALTEIEDVPTSIIDRYTDTIFKIDVFFIKCCKGTTLFRLGIIQRRKSSVGKTFD